MAQKLEKVAQFAQSSFLYTETTKIYLPATGKALERKQFWGRKPLVYIPEGAQYGGTRL